MKFDYSFDEVSQDKRVRRTEVVGPAKVPEIVGADMRIAGGLRLFPGFKKIRTLPGFNINSANTSEVTEFRPFSVIAGTENKVHGWVYRVEGSTTSSWVIDWYDPTDSGWNTETLKSGVANASADLWSIVVVGRLLYLYIKGVRPILWYLDPTSAPGFTTVVNEETGPGAPPPAPQVGLTFHSWSRLNNSGDPIPITEFPYVDEGSVTPPLTEDVVIDFSDSDILLPGNYNFAIQFANSVTGLVSNLSQVETVMENRFIERVPFDRTQNEDGTETINYRSVGVPQGWSMTFVVPPEFDQVSIYRSVGIQGVGPNAVSSILYLERFYDDTTDLTSHTGTLSDPALVLKSTFDQATVYDAEPPYGGVAVNYGEAIFVSAIGGSGTVDKFSEIGEVRWSLLADIGPELFPPGNRYVPKHASDDIICWFDVADVLHGASKSRIFECDRTGRYAVFRSIFEGYGAVSQDAAVGFGPATLLVTHQGIKELGANGQMLNVNAFNLVVLDEWKSSLSRISCAYDTSMGVILVLNPVEQKCLCLWTETRQTSELWHVPFAYAGEGVDPESGSTQSRALFVTPSGVVYRVDDKEEKTFSSHPDSSKNGSTYKTTLETDGEHFVEVTEVSGSLVTVRDPDGENIGWDDLRDVWAFFPTQGEWRQVSFAPAGTGATKAVRFKTTAPSGLAAGHRVLLDPVHFRVMGYGLGVPIDRDGRGMVTPTRWTQTTAATIGGFFEAVSGTGLDQIESTFRGSLYRGLEVTPFATATTRDSSGDPAAAITALGGPTIFARFDTFGAKDQILLPVLEVVCPDIDFVLLGMRIDGNMMSNSTNTRQ